MIRVRTDSKGTPSWAGLMAAGLLALLCAVAIGPACAQQPDLELAVQPADTLALAVNGTVRGMAWVGPDTLALLTEIPDSLSASGRRQVRLVFQSRGGRVLLNQDFTGVLDRALGYDGEFLWGCGDGPDGGSLLFKIKVDTLRVEETYELHGHRPVGLCFDGRYLWVSDRDSGKLDRFDPETEAITRTVVSPGFSPHGVAWDGRNMWVSDSGTGRMYRLSGSRRDWTATVNTDSFWHRGEDILLGHDGFSLWYVQEPEQYAIRVIFP